MTPPEKLSGSMASADQRVTFQATSIMQAELRQEVSEQMVRAAETHWGIYEWYLKNAPDNQTRTNMDFFFAVWPDLPSLISDKKVAVRVRPEEVRKSIGDGAIMYSYTVKQRILLATFHMNDWNVTLTFNDACGYEALWESVHRKSLEVTEEARAKRR